MPYRLLSRDGNLADGLRRIAEEQLIKAASALDSPRVDDREAVHELRKRCKRIRAVLRLVRFGLEDSSVFTQENASYRSLARELSPFRDATAMIESFDDLLWAYEQEVDQAAFSPIRAALVVRRDALQWRSEFADRLEDARIALMAAQRRVPLWTRVPDEFDALAGGLERTVWRASRAMRAIDDDPTPERFHEWRKRVNDHRHHCRILMGVFENSMKARSRSLARVAAQLGQVHDLDLLERTLRADALFTADDRSLEALLGLIDVRRTNLREQACSLGAKIFCEHPTHFMARTRTRYELWRRELRSSEERIVLVVPDAQHKKVPD